MRRPRLPRQQRLPPSLRRLQFVKGQPDWQCCRACMLAAPPIPIPLSSTRDSGSLFRSDPSRPRTHTTVQPRLPKKLFARCRPTCHPQHPMPCGSCPTMTQKQLIDRLRASRSGPVATACARRPALRGRAARRRTPPAATPTPDDKHRTTPHRPHPFHSPTHPAIRLPNHPFTHPPNPTFPRHGQANICQAYPDPPTMYTRCPAVAQRQRPHPT